MSIYFICLAMLEVAAIVCIALELFDYVVQWNDVRKYKRMYEEMGIRSSYVLQWNPLRNLTALILAALVGGYLLVNWENL